jgi:hypothetical protein
LSEVKKKAGFLEKEGESIEFWLQPNGLHPNDLSLAVRPAADRVAACGLGTT